MKFAKVRALPADNVEAFDNAVNFIKETIEKEPEPIADESNSTYDKANSEIKKGGDR